MQDNRKKSVFSSNVGETEDRQCSGSAVKLRETRSIQDVGPNTEKERLCISSQRERMGTPSYGEQSSTAASAKKKQEEKVQVSVGLYKRELGQISTRTPMTRSCIKHAL